MLSDKAITSTFSPGSALSAAVQVLEVDGKEAERVIEALKEEGYVCGLFGDNPPPDTVQTTPKGSILASAHARPPISREEAKRLMDEFMGRVRVVRDDDRFLYEPSFWP